MDFHYLLGVAMVLEAEASLTAKNQITIPVAVRKALKLQGDCSQVKFQILPEDGRVMVLRGEVPREREDPGLKPFLALLQKDMRMNPRRFAPFPAPLLEKASSLVEGMEVDLDSPLTCED